MSNIPEVPELSRHPDQPVEKTGPKMPYITTTEGMSGHFAVMLWWNPDMGGFWEPWDTGIGRFATRAEAVEEAKAWAEAEEVEYKEAM